MLDVLFSRKINEDHSRSCLIVDDVKEARELFESCLDGIPNLVCVCTGSYCDALDKLKQLHFDVAILDYNLDSDCTGIDIAREINQHSPETRIMLVSAYELPDKIDAKIDVFSDKPISVDELMKFVKGE